MHLFLTVVSLLSSVQAAFSAPTSQGPYTPVSYTEAPSYYPGAPWQFGPKESRWNVCVVEAAGNGQDDAPSVIEAFQRCGKNGKVIFKKDTTYHIKSVMEITGLSNVEVDIKGTLLWSDDVSYWLEHSMPMGYQNQSTAFIFGGDQIHIHGGGVGTFNGNGQVWYDRFGSISNYPRRPHQITFRGLTNSVIEGINFLQPQMWTMTLIHSSKVLLQDIYVNSTNVNGGENLNTDGADTIYASDITFTRWTVIGGDDNISFKANSTNILVEDCDFHGTTGVAYGSIGQFEGQVEIIEDITVRNIAAYNNKYGAYIKTWTGVSQGTPPNGGGGGLGYLRNVTMRDFKVINAEQGFYITQCNSFSGFTGECDTSEFEISDLSIRGMTGYLKTDVVASMQCSGRAPCRDISLRDISLGVAGDDQADKYLCSNVRDADGFTCNGKPPQSG